MARQARSVAEPVRWERTALAERLGLPPRRVTDDLLVRIADDPLLLHHLELCRDDPALLDLLLGPESATPASTDPESTGPSDRPGRADPGEPTGRRAADPDARRAAATPTGKLVGRAGAALVKWAASGFDRVGPDEYRRRLAVCRACEHLSAPPAGSLVHRLAGTAADSRSVCGLCGCDVRRKAWLATEHCPDGRWEEAADG